MTDQLQGVVQTAPDRRSWGLWTQYEDHPVHARFLTALGQVAEYEQQRTRRALFPSGHLHVGDRTIYDRGATPHGGALVVGATAADRNTFYIYAPEDEYHVLVNGWLLTLYHVRANQATSAPSADYLAIKLPDPPATGGRRDLVFLEVWRAEIAAGDTIRPWGSVDSTAAAIPNDLVDSREADGQVNGLVEVRSRIRVVRGIAWASHPHGLSNAAQVKARGAASADTNYTFTRRGSVDPGLWRAGDGSDGARTALGSTDGYTYALPIAVVARRNQAAYHASTNPNGAGAIGGTSGRPDGLFNDQVAALDLADLRQQVLGPDEALGPLCRRTSQRLLAGTYARVVRDERTGRTDIWGALHAKEDTLTTNGARRVFARQPTEQRTIGKLSVTADSNDLARVFEFTQNNSTISITPSRVAPGARVRGTPILRRLNGTVAPRRWSTAETTGVVSTSGVVADEFSLAGGNANPEGVSYHNGRIYVLDNADNKLYAYRPSDGLPDPTSDITLSGTNAHLTAHAVAFSATRIYILQRISSTEARVFVCTHDGVEQVAEGSSLNPLNDFPTGIAIRDGHLYAADKEDDVVYAYQINSDGLHYVGGGRGAGHNNFLSSPASDPTGMCYDSTNQRFYVITPSAGGRVEAFNNSGVHQAADSFDTRSANAGPEGIATDGTNLWIADWQDNKIYAYNTDGSTPTRLVGHVFVECDIDVPGTAQLEQPSQTEDRLRVGTDYAHRIKEAVADLDVADFPTDNQIGAAWDDRGIAEIVKRATIRAAAGARAGQAVAEAAGPVIATSDGTKAGRLVTRLNPSQSIQVLYGYTPPSTESIVADYSFRPQRSPVLPPTLAVRILYMEDTLYVSNLGSGLGRPGQPYSAPLRHLPEHSSLANDDPIRNADDLVLTGHGTNGFDAFGLLTTPVLSHGGTDRLRRLQSPAADPLGRPHYTAADAEVFAWGLGLAEAQWHRTAWFGIARVTADSGAFTAGELVLIAFSESANSTYNRAGVGGDGTAYAVGVWPLGAITNDRAG